MLLQAEILVHVKFENLKICRSDQVLVWTTVRSDSVWLRLFNLCIIANYHVFCITLWPYWRMPPIKLRYIGMKKTILFITFVICAVCAYSQTGLAKALRMDTELNISNQSLQAVSQLPVGDAYKNTPEWGKYKALSTVGWTTFGVGMTATCVGGYLYLLFSNINGSDKAHPG